MRINQNIAALNAWRSLGNTDGALGKSLERLSSGLRITRAADDAAGLAISEKMRGQVRGLNQAVSNAQSGISLIQTAEGALTESHAILQRMRELSVQAANDTLTESDRGEIQKEIDQLVFELDRIADTTEFNTKLLLTGNTGVGMDTAGVIKGIKTNANTEVAKYEVDVTAMATGASASIDKSALTSNIGNNLTINGKTFEIPSDGAEDDEAVALADLVANINSGDAGVTATIGESDKLVITSNTVGTASVLTVKNNTTNVDVTDGTNAVATVTSSAGGTFTATGVANDFTVADAGGNNVMSFTAVSVAKVNVEVNAALTFQIGANEGQHLSVSMNSMNALNLGVSKIDINTVEGAGKAITMVNEAIDNVSAERSKLGAIQNRLEHTIKNLSVASENMSAAESRIRDVDMASEMMTFTKNQILSQAGIAMLAQANMRPQSVLQLLG